MIAEYVAQRQQEGDTRDAQDIAVAYNDTVIYPDKVRLHLIFDFGGAFCGSKLRRSVLIGRPFFFVVFSLLPFIWERKWCVGDTHSYLPHTQCGE